MLRDENIIITYNKYSFINAYRENYDNCYCTINISIYVVYDDCIIDQDYLYERLSHKLTEKYKEYRYNFYAENEHNYSHDKYKKQLFFGFYTKNSEDSYCEYLSDIINYAIRYTKLENFS